MILIRYALPALLLMGAAGPASAQLRYMGPDEREAILQSISNAPGGMRYESDGNAKNPAAIENPAVPSYQRGSGQTTGGPARELIPPSRGLFW